MATSAPPVAVTVAPQHDRASLVLIGGMVLIGAELMVTPATRVILGNIFRKPAAAKPLGNGQAPGILDMALQGGLVLGLYALASISDAAGALAVAVLVAMWLVFLVHYSSLFGGSSK